MLLLGMNFDEKQMQGQSSCIGKNASLPIFLYDTKLSCESDWPSAVYNTASYSEDAIYHNILHVITCTTVLVCCHHGYNLGMEC